MNKTDLLLERYLAVGLAVVASACFEPVYSQGLACGPDRWCPPGLYCASGADICLAPASMDIAQQVDLAASNPGIDDEFGWSVALWGDTLAVGASFEDGGSIGPHGAYDADQDDDSATKSGAVYVFRRRGDTWIQEAYIKASNVEAADYFGISVALWGDTLAVGASFEDGSVGGIQAGPLAGQGDGSDAAVTNSGAVYVFRRVGSTWHQEAYIKPPAPGEYDSFGRSVALWGDTLAVGAFREGTAPDGAQCADVVEGANAHGSVYVFRRDDTTWSQEAHLTASNKGNADNFGWSVALWDHTLAVGAYCEDSAEIGPHLGSGGNQADDSATKDSGAVYVFRQDGSSWSQEAYIKSSNTDGGDLFGISVALSGELLAVGAPYEDSSAMGAYSATGDEQADNTATNSGAVYLFRRSGNVWIQDAYIKASNTGSGDELGRGSIALWGDILVAGAPGEDSTARGPHGAEDGGEQLDNSATDSGAAYVLRRSETGEWSQQAYLKGARPDLALSNSEDSYSSFGWSVAVHGSAIAVGMYGQDGAAGAGTGGSEGPVEDSGAVYLFQ